MIDEKRDLSFIIMARKDRASSFPNNNISEYIYFKLSVKLGTHNEIDDYKNYRLAVLQWTRESLLYHSSLYAIVSSSYHYYSPFLFVQMHPPSSSNLFSPIPGKCFFFFFRRSSPDIVQMLCVYPSNIIPSGDKNLKLIPRLFLYIYVLCVKSL